MKKIPRHPCGNWVVQGMNKNFARSFPGKPETQPKPKTWDRKITSKRQALRETARLWRYVARTGEGKPNTNWDNDCPLCDFLHCENCINNFWGAVKDPETDVYYFMDKKCLCLESAASAYLKWRQYYYQKLSSCKTRYYALRIRWAALRSLNDHFSS